MGTADAEDRPALDPVAALAWIALISRLQFLARSPLGFTVECDVFVWNNLVERKHRVMRGLDTEVQRSIEHPSEIRRSRRDPAVLLFYRRFRERWLCAVVAVTVRRANLITAYPTDAIKQGVVIWTRSE